MSLATPFLCLGPLTPSGPLYYTNKAYVLLMVSHRLIYPPPMNPPNLGAPYLEASPKPPEFGIWYVSDTRLDCGVPLNL